LHDDQPQVCSLPLYGFTSFFDVSPVEGKAANAPFDDGGQVQKHGGHPSVLMP
jgi:hypothetical protein